MLLRKSHQIFLNSKPLLGSAAYRPFSTIDTVSPMSKEKVVKDIRGMLYKPIEKLEFDKDDRCLLYYYIPRFYTYPLMYSKYLIPFGILAKLIATNPFSVAFPVAFPLMIFMEVYRIFHRKLYHTKKYLHTVVGEAYLLKDGETIEIVYENKFWRKLRSRDSSNFYYTPTLKTPPKDDETQPLKGDLFPEQYPYNELNPAGWAWKKFYRNPRTNFVFPKRANYANMEILIAIFNGKTIDTSKQNIVELDHFKKEKYEWM